LRRSGVFGERGTSFSHKLRKKKILVADLKLVFTGFENDSRKFLGLIRA